MAFTFVHTADWQIGKPFGRFEAEKAAVLRHARLEAIDRIAAAAAKRGAAHALVAGDVLDSEHLPDRLVQGVLARLAAAAAITWHLLPGNHDPARAGGIWDVVRRSGLPENVRLHLRAEAAEIAPGVHLLPAPLQARATSSDPTAWMEAAPTAAGLRIGLAHGSVRSFGEAGAARVPIDAGRAARAGLDYLALGDWHGVRQIGAATWYSGTPEPDSFTDNAPGHVLIVRLEAPRAPPEVEVVPTAAFRWLSQTIEVDAALYLEALEARLAASGLPTGACLVELALGGRLSQTQASGLERRLAALAGRLFHLDVDRTRLDVAARPDDVASLPDGALRDIARRLEEQARSADAAEARVAARALALLFALHGAAEPAEAA